MTRSFYSAAIFFTGVYLLVSFLLSVISYLMGERVVLMQTFDSLVILYFLILLVWSLIFLKYYHYKQYWFPFWAVVVSLPAFIFQFVLLQNILIAWEDSVYYYPSIFLALGMDILYGISLVFSMADRRRWLKLAGILMIFSGLARVSILTWGMISVDVRASGIVSEVDLWVSLVYGLGLVFFILNFSSEKETAEEERTSHQQPLVGAMNVVGFMALVTTLYFGVKAGYESKWILDHPNHVPAILEEMAEPFEARTYVNSQGDSLRYRWMKPLDYDSMRQYPLVISLHGSVARGSDNAKQIVGTLLPRLLSKPENRKKYPAFLFVPQCPLNSWWGDSSGDLRIDSLVIECVFALEKVFAIDKNRRYVSGASMGGYGTWHLISTRPEMFAAAVPMAGGGNPALAPNMVDVPVWAFHGARDGLVPVSGSRDMIEAIKTAGGAPRYTEYPDVNHNLSEQITNTPELLDWLFAQERD